MTCRRLQSAPGGAHPDATTDGSPVGARRLRRFRLRGPKSNRFSGAAATVQRPEGRAPWWIAAVLALALAPQSVRACAACFGQSDSELARGMNWGIFTLLLIVGCVLAGITSFFIFLAHKAASHPAAPKPSSATESTAIQ